MKAGKTTPSQSTPDKPRRKSGAATPRAKKRTVAVAPSPQERRELIARIAYFRAEARGFAPGGELDDWVAAEAEVDGQFAESR